VWVAIGKAATGIQTLLPGTKIGIEGGATSKVTNLGVIQILPVINGGINVFNGNTQDPILGSAGVVTVQPADAGISIEYFQPQTATITNQGTVALYPNLNGGLTITVDGQKQATITNNGVLAVSALLGSGLTIDYPISPQIPNITNNGLLSVAGGLGITTTELNYGVEMLNDGLVKLNGGYGCTVVPGPSGSVIFPKSSRLSKLWIDGTVIGMTPSSFNGTNGQSQTQFGVFDWIPVPGSLFSVYMANGLPPQFTSGLFFIDLSAFTININPNNRPAVGINTLSCVFSDTITPGGPYKDTQFFSFTTRIAAAASTQSVTLGRTMFDVKVARANGLRTVNKLTIYAGIDTSSQTTFTATCFGDGWATFYPQARPF